MKNLEVIALIKFKAEQVSEILDSLKVLVEESRKEKGCIKYNLIDRRYRYRRAFYHE